MKPTILLTTIIALLYFPATAGSPSPRRESINSFKNPISRRITPAQFKASCVKQLIPMHIIQNGVLIRTQKHALTPEGPSTRPTGAVPERLEYKIIQTLDDTLFLARTDQPPIPTEIIQLPNHTRGEILNLRLFNSDKKHTVKFKIDGQPKDITLNICFPWGNPPHPTPAQLLTAFNNGTPFQVIMPTGPSKLPTLYTVSIK